MTQQTILKAAFVRIVSAVNALKGAQGNLSSLTTTDKANLVAALNEVKGSIPTAGAVIDDVGSGTTKTWSSNKIQSQITAAITALISGSPEASDTLKELSDQIAALSQADNGLLSFAAAQALSAQQKLQGCNNLGIGDPAFDYVADIEANLSVGL